MAHFLPGPGAYFSTAESIPDEQEDLNSDSEAKYMKQFITYVTKNNINYSPYL